VNSISKWWNDQKIKEEKKEGIEKHVEKRQKMQKGEL